MCLFKPLYKHDTVSYKRTKIMLACLCTGDRGFHTLSPPNISLIISLEKPSKLACLWVMRLTGQSGSSRNEMNENVTKVHEWNAGDYSAKNSAADHSDQNLLGLMAKRRLRGSRGSTGQFMTLSGLAYSLHPMGGIVAC